MCWRIYSRPRLHQITQLLVAWGNGDRAARDELMPLVYDELRRLAHRHMGRERPDHTLQTSALVNEAYLRLIDQKDVHTGRTSTLLWDRRANDASYSGGLMMR